MDERTENLKEHKKIEAKFNKIDRKTRGKKRDIEATTTKTASQVQRTPKDIKQSINKVIGHSKKSTMNDEEIKKMFDDVRNKHK